MKIIYPEGATPLDPNEIEGLLPSITTQRELNDLEKANIQDGRSWAVNSRKLKKELLSYSGVLLLHHQMFGKVWAWAGQQRTTEKSIGIDPFLIPEQSENVCRDARTWLEYQTYAPTELAVRFHHRLVKIYPFANGNGRHARLAANLLLRFNGHSELTWGSTELVDEGAKRTAYLASLKDADRGNYDRLVEFAQS